MYLSLFRLLFSRKTAAKVLLFFDICKYKIHNKKYIYYVYIVNVTEMPKKRFYPMVILRLSYGDPTVRVLYGVGDGEGYMVRG